MLVLDVKSRLVSVAVLVFGTVGPLTASDAKPSGPHIVMIIRHAEKTGDKTDPDLSKQGYERAEALAKTFPANFPRPDYLIATKRSKSSNRPVETITPLSNVLHEEIEAKYSDKENDQLAHELLTDPKFAGKTVLIAWHHGKLPELAKALGAKGVPDKWDDNVFNRVWEITYENGVATWKDLPENALPDDAESKSGK